MTVVTIALLGVVYPLAITGVAQVLFPEQANGQLLERNGRVVGSRLIGQPFSSPGYFHSRPSAAGAGYDAARVVGIQPRTDQQEADRRVAADVARLRAENPTCRCRSIS